MGVWIGTDEAGFGPNLGPLVIGLTRWEGPVDDLREGLAEVASEAAVPAKLRLTDSKAIHKPAAVRGGDGNASDALAASELAIAARGLLAAAGINATTLRDLVVALDPEHADALAGVPWLVEAAPVPCPDDPRIGRFAAGVRAAGLTLQVRADVIPAAAYNALLDRVGSKGQLLSRRTLRLLRSVWTPGDAATIVCDKHGGRDKYTPLLQEFAFDIAAADAPSDSLFGPAIETLEEGRLRSRYRIAGDGTATAITFEQKAESHLPVACASIVAKWLRERAMDAFNAYWTARQPGLRPTRGYPNDAARWRDDLATLDCDENTLWRRK